MSHIPLSYFQLISTFSTLLLMCTIPDDFLPPTIPACHSQPFLLQVELAWRLGEGDLPEHVRRLTEEHTRLQNEHSRARVRLEEMESLRDELQKLKVSLEEERAEKEEVQGELDRTSQRVKDMLVSMEGVEHGESFLSSFFSDEFDYYVWNLTL